MNQKKLRAAVEAMLFAYAEPIGADKLAQALQMPVSSVEPVLEELRTRYAREDSGLCLLQTKCGQFFQCFDVWLFNNLFKDFQTTFIIVFGRIGNH